MVCCDRVKVTLDDGSYRAVRRLSELTGKSMSAVISGVLVPIVPSMNDLADLLQKAKQENDVYPEFLSALLDTAVGHLASTVASQNTSSELPEEWPDDDYDFERMEVRNEEW